MLESYGGVFGVVASPSSDDAAVVISSIPLGKMIAHVCCSYG